MTLCSFADVYWLFDGTGEEIYKTSTQQTKICLFELHSHPCDNLKEVSFK
jgi:hypothetical protein